ncbi:MAG: hypothetical protein JXR30_01125 [Alphaproteobacteria bacterium]|nr:hypothetical protein [Alphaproteobacteria bacterium]
MRSGFFFFFVSFLTVSAWGQFDPAMLQQGAGTVMNVVSRVKEVKSGAGSCKYSSSSDGTYILNLAKEHNKECVANDKTIITLPTELKDRAKAKALFTQLTSASGCWSFADFTPDELKRINEITNPIGCAGQAIQVLGGVKEQILAPMIGQMMPGAEGILGGDGTGGLGALQGLFGGEAQE